MKDISIVFLILLKISIELVNITNIIVLPFKTYKEPYNESNPLSSIINNHIYTEISIGNQILVASFRTEDYGFYMTNENCINESNYLIQNSKSFTNKSQFEENKPGYASEILTLYRDINLKIKQNGYFEKMFISSYNDQRQCAIFGLKIKEQYYEYENKPNFIKTYKSNDNIKNYRWTLKYNSNDEGLLVVGDTPTEYDPSFKNKKYEEYMTQGIPKQNLPSFGIKFDEITINHKSLNLRKEAYFYHEINAILVDLDFFNNISQIFFDKYEEKNICEKSWVKSQYGYILCHKNFTEKDKNSFPTIYFKHKDLNYIFELNHNDLFYKEIDGEWYFLIIYEMKNNGLKFGKPFLKKYTFTVDNDNSDISFFIFEKEEKKNYLLVIILSIFISILIIVVIFLVYKLMTKKTEKRRANELDDDYEYATKNDEINNNSQIPLANNLGV